MGAEAVDAEVAARAGERGVLIADAPLRPQVDEPRGGAPLRDGGAGLARDRDDARDEPGEPRREVGRREGAQQRREEGVVLREVRVRQARGGGERAALGGRVGVDPPRGALEARVRRRGDGEPVRRVREARLSARAQRGQLDSAQRGIVGERDRGLAPGRRGEVAAQLAAEDLPAQLPAVALAARPAEVEARGGRGVRRALQGLGRDQVAEIHLRALDGEAQPLAAQEPPRRVARVDAGDARLARDGAEADAVRLQPEEREPVDRAGGRPLLLEVEIVPRDRPRDRRPPGVGEEREEQDEDRPDDGSAAWPFHFGDGSVFGDVESPRPE